jgi:hypothetical protein
VRRLAREIETHRALVQAFVDERQLTYWDAADGIKSVRDRDLTRISDKFAGMHIAGCLASLASRYKILPFPEAEILEALLTCERDHVAFIDRELGLVPPSRSSPRFLALSSTSRLALHNHNRLRRYIKHSSRRRSRRGFTEASSTFPRGLRATVRTS